MKRSICRRQFFVVFSSASLGVCLRSLTASEVETVTQRFLRNYAEILHATYSDVLQATRQMQETIGKFLKSPSEAGLQTARTAWITARQPYLQSEAARFYDGPIDAVEGFINSWPIDENYIDYAVDDPKAGIINNTLEFPRITKELLLSLNEKEGEKNISTGWHAIEFLLWGQDLYEDGPGRRSHLDYVDGEGEVRAHADRRREYLRLVAGLLVQHLQKVADEWVPGREGNYRAQFLKAAPHESLEKVIRGMGAFSGAELGGERTMVAYTTKEQEDEHSCFSDMTHQDMRYDQIGILNFCSGRYQRLDKSEVRGAGLLEVIREKDALMADKLQRQSTEALKAIEAVPVPFDQAMKGRDTAPGRVALKKAIDAIQAQTQTMAAAAKELGIQLNL